MSTTGDDPTPFDDAAWERIATDLPTSILANVLDRYATGETGEPRFVLIEAARRLRQGAGVTISDTVAHGGITNDRITLSERWWPQTAEVLADWIAGDPNRLAEFLAWAEKKKEA